MNIFRTLIVPASDVEVARKVGAGFGTGGQGMWTTPLSPTGEEPATHYVSTGWIPPEFASLVPTQYWLHIDGAWVKTGEDVGNPDMVFQVMQQAGVDVTFEDIESLYASADVTEQDPHTAMERLGIEMIRSTDII